ncbi:DUF2815 family protein [Clostridium oceanicum]|uniref:DUF2815 family protein n=1 Tax=Clostridium oceanicum TaxID=1543 RepID=A0ABN1JKD3_9CLOT
MKTKVITGKVRFSYANVWEPKSINGSDPKYSVSLIISKKDKITVEKVKKAIEVAKKEGKSKFQGEGSGILKMPLKDGDLEKIGDETYENSYFINANSNTKPGIVDRNVNPIIQQNDFYSGCYGRASIVFYPYNENGNKGIACGLQNLQKTDDGEILTGHSRPEDDFEVIEGEDFLS